MIRRLLLTTFAVGLLAGTAWAGAPSAFAYPTMYTHFNRAARWHNANTQWHRNYAHNAWQQPVALIAPPVANTHTSWSWGVGRTRVVPTYHQFTRPYVAPGGGGAGSASPNWPSSTMHRGAYWVRGPW